MIGDNESMFFTCKTLQHKLTVKLYKIFVAFLRYKTSQKEQEIKTVILVQILESSHTILVWKLPALYFSPESVVLSVRVSPNIVEADLYSYFTAIDHGHTK